MDDFCSGWSWFAYRRTLDADYPKIDGLVVRNIADDPIGRAMLRSINDMGHVMGQRTSTEFVEGEGSLSVLREIGIVHARGYLVAKLTLVVDLAGTS